MGVEKFNKIKEEEGAKEVLTSFEYDMHVPKYLKNRLNLKHNNYNAYINAEVDKLVDTFTFGIISFL